MKKSGQLPVNIRTRYLRVYRIDVCRQEADTFLRGKGFQGTYPEYYKESMWIQAAEEQPFTILESSDYVFRIYFMISERKKGRCGRNSTRYLRVRSRVAELKGMNRYHENSRAESFHLIDKEISIR